MARIDAVLKPFDLTFARFELLRLLSFTRHGSLPMAFASSRLQVHPTSVTNAVDRLERAGLVTRGAHPDDRRALVITLTAEGRALAEKATATLNTEVFARPGLEAADLERLVEVLTRLRRDAGDF
jgi:DNA-binding MarR family transcriptional regulator